MAEFLDYRALDVYASAQAHISTVSAVVSQLYLINLSVHQAACISSMYLYIKKYSNKYKSVTQPSFL